MFSGKKKVYSCKSGESERTCSTSTVFLNRPVNYCSKIHWCVVFFLLSSYFIFTFVLLFVDLTVFIRCRRIKLSFKHYLLLSSFISFHSHRISAVGCGLAGVYAGLCAYDNNKRQKTCARAAYAQNNNRFYYYYIKCRVGYTIRIYLCE